jgi:hypothetical protein
MTNSPVHKPNYDNIYLLIGLAFTVYLCARAILIPITIDEAGSYLNYTSLKLWDIMMYKKDPTPNNHILNTIGMKLFSSLFGTTTFTVRLTNLLAFVLYFTMAVKLLKKMRNELLFVLSGIFVLVCNPYMLDFFALARGYGLSIGLMMWSLYHVYVFIAEKNINAVVPAVIAGALAVYANFTLLNYFIVLFGISMFMLMYYYKHQSEVPIFKNVTIVLFVTIVLGLLIYLPIQRMVNTDQFVYWGTESFYASTLLPLIDSIRYGELYFNFRKAEPYVVMYILLFAVFGATCIGRCIRLKWAAINDFTVITFLILSGIIAATILQFHLIDVPFLNARGAVFLYPVFGLILMSVVNKINFSKPLFQRSILVLLMIMGLTHFFLTANFYSFRDWWFDAHTKEVFNWIDEQHPGKEKVTLNTSWVFSNSMHFHKITDNRFNVEIATFHHDLQPDGNYQYYYCQRGDVETLSKNYEPVHSYHYGEFIIMKKKE